MGSTIDEGANAVPTVSICIPTYNGARYVVRTIDSVLRQTFTDYEVIVGDDGSTDETLAVVRTFDDPRVRILPDCAPAGVAANWNRTIAAARGTYVKLLCQDDLISPECLERQVEAMVQGADRDVVLVSCKRDIVDADDRVRFRGRGWRGARGVIDASTTIRSIVRAGANLIGEPSATLCRVDVLRAAGGFSSDHTYVLDMDAYVRILAHGSLSYIPESLCAFRMSSTSWSASLSRRQAGAMRVLLRDLRDAHPDAVSRRDLVTGLAKATAIALLRRGAFTVSSARVALAQRRER